MMDQILHKLPWLPVVLGASSATAIVATFWGKFKSWLRYFWSYGIVTVRCENGLGRVLLSYMPQKYKRSPFGDKFYSSESVFVRSLEKVRRVAFRNFGITREIYWHKRFPIWVSGTSSSSNGELASPEKSTDSGDTSKYKVAFSFI